MRTTNNFTFIKIIALIVILLLLVSCSMFHKSMDQKDFFAAELSSVDSYLYGKFVVRMRAAKGNGIISNFFTFKNNGQLKGVSWQEIDVEVFGKNGANQWQSNIIVDLKKKVRKEAIHNAEFLAETYNTYTIEWTPKYVQWSLNGHIVRKVTSKLVQGLNKPASFRFNIWLPNAPAWVGSFKINALPVGMYVNWMEYHNWNNGLFQLEWRDDFNSLNAKRWRALNHTFKRNLAHFTYKNVNVYNGYLVLTITKHPKTGFDDSPPTDKKSK